MSIWRHSKQRTSCPTKLALAPKVILLNVVSNRMLISANTTQIMHVIPTGHITSMYTNEKETKLSDRDVHWSFAKHADTSRPQHVHGAVPTYMKQ